MKGGIFTLITLGIVTVIMMAVAYKIGRSELPHKAYTVKMIFGNSKIWYSSEMQVDSLRWISNQQILVYADSHPLSISAAYISFKKN